MCSSTSLGSIIDRRKIDVSQPASAPQLVTAAPVTPIKAAPEHDVDSIHDWEHELSRASDFSAQIQLLRSLIKTGLSHFKDGIVKEDSQKVKWDRERIFAEFNSCSKLPKDWFVVPVKTYGMNLEQAKQIGFNELLALHWKLWFLVRENLVHAGLISWAPQDRIAAHTKELLERARAASPPAVKEG